MNSKIRNSILFSAILLTGCANNGGGAGGIIVDTKNVDSVKYSQDDRECQNYAESQSVAASAGGGAAVGALFGLLVGAILDRQNMYEYGRAGAVGGLAGGTAKGVEGKDTIYRNCMRNRGYSVLN